MKRGFNILLAEDTPNDVSLLRHAIGQSATCAHIPINLQVVSEGVEAIAYLSGEGEFANRRFTLSPN